MRSKKRKRTWQKNRRRSPVKYLDYHRDLWGMAHIWDGIFHHWIIHWPIYAQSNEGELWDWWQTALPIQGLQSAIHDSCSHRMPLGAWKLGSVQWTLQSESQFSKFLHNLNTSKPTVPKWQYLVSAPRLFRQLLGSGGVGIDEGLPYASPCNEWLQSISVNHVAFSPVPVLYFHAASASFMTSDMSDCIITSPSKYPILNVCMVSALAVGLVFRGLLHHIIPAPHLA